MLGECYTGFVTACRILYRECGCFEGLIKNVCYLESLIQNVWVPVECLYCLWVLGGCYRGCFVAWRMF